MIKFQYTTRRHIPGNKTLHSHRPENLKFHILFQMFRIFYSRKISYRSCVCKLLEWTVTAWTLTAGAWTGGGGRWYASSRSNCWIMQWDDPESNIYTRIDCLTLLYTSVKYAMFPLCNSHQIYLSWISLLPFCFVRDEHFFSYLSLFIDFFFPPLGSSSYIPSAGIK